MTDTTHIIKLNWFRKILGLHKYILLDLVKVQLIMKVKVMSFKTNTVNIFIATSTAELQL